MRFNEIVVPYGTIRKLAKDTGLSEPCIRHALKGITNSDNSILKPIAVRAYGYVTPDREGVRYPSPRGVKTEEIIGDTKIIGELLGYRLLVKVLVSDYDTLPSHPERQLYTGIPRRSHPRQIHVVAFPQYGIKPLFRPSVIYGLNVCQRIDRKTLVLILGQLV